MSGILPSIFTLSKFLPPTGPEKGEVGAPPMCHFTPMEYAFADNGNCGQVEFWECRHCGHTEEIASHTGPV